VPEISAMRIATAVGSSRSAGRFRPIPRGKEPLQSRTLRKLKQVWKQKGRAPPVSRFPTPWVIRIAPQLELRMPAVDRPTEPLCPWSWGEGAGYRETREELAADGHHTSQYRMLCLEGSSGERHEQRLPCLVHAIGWTSLGSSKPE
jgi:hypothetical protein